MSVILLYNKIRNQTTTPIPFLCWMYNYYTTKLEIKPQRDTVAEALRSNYYTTKLEIKPQRR